MTSHVIDRDLLYFWVDRKRRQRRIRWRQVATETGIAASSLTRWGQGHALSADATASLMGWSGVPCDIVIRKRGPRSTTAT